MNIFLLLHFPKLLKSRGKADMRAAAYPALFLPDRYKALNAGAIDPQKTGQKSS
jgi:hypothetical protein